MRTSIYVTDPKTDRILYMNGFMKHDYGVEDPEGKVCWQVLQRRLTERCAFCPVDELLSCGDEVPLVEWDEESPMTGRTYRNYDSLVTWVDGSRVHLQQSVDITALVSANTDELTGMLSRRAGKERLGHLACAGCSRGRAGVRRSIRHQPAEGCERSSWPCRGRLPDPFG